MLGKNSEQAKEHIETEQLSFVPIGLANHDRVGNLGTMQPQAAHRMTRATANNQPLLANMD